MRQLSPFDCLQKLDDNVCVWLNGSPDAERPIWTRLWNSSKKRYCTDGGANRVVKRTPKLASPDVVLGDMDSIQSEVAEALRPTTRLIDAPDQDKTDLTKCLEFIAEDFKNHAAPRIVLLGGTSGRFDHVLAAINSLYNSTNQLQLEVYCLDGENLTFVLDEGEHSVKIDRQSVTGTCGVVPFCQKPTVVTMKGFRWDLENATMAFGGVISTSNYMEKDVLYVQTSAPLIFTIELQPLALV
uniref:Thiamine diphosphokinase n=1 Tax=Haemonchus contortus TaxID=6289 RepID=A0A7I4YDF3_HAECO|nr:Thiamin pyrophosphokinase domain containing protein [Haemonchus contortus]